MKKVYTICLLLIAACFFNTSYAQVNTEGRMGKEGGPYWILGLNAGGAWQDSDIKSRPGAGWGFYLGRSIMHNPQNPISADVRFRYMGTLTYGQNAADTEYGNANLAKSFNYLDSSAFAHNHETELHDLSLEARINFEELRRKSRIMLSLYGGVGLGIHNTMFDQLDFDGNEYDYASAAAATEEATIEANELLRDNIYETNAHDDFQATFTPSVGAELGYWFSPHFALSLGHRTTFPLSGNLDGISGSKAGSDIHHYTSLNLHWRINEGNSSSSSTTPCPKTEFNLPVKNNASLTTSSSSVFISASISNVKNNQITYTVNNQRSYNFTYNEQSDEFRANLPLVVGENIVSIMAKNSCGISSEYIKVIYQPQTNVTKNPPVIQFTNPVSSPYNTTSPLFVAMANITNITSSSQLTFQVNGQNQNFSFNNGSLVSSEFTLSAGLNTIRITATNQDGSDVETATVILENNTPPVQLPDVIITSPTSNPFTTSASAVGISATISNVGSINDVQVQVNGQVYNSFTFDGFNLSINNLSLDPGSTTVTIQGSNAAGTDMETQIIIHNPQTQEPPVITFVDPVASPHTVSDPVLDFTTSILNITGSSQISYQINGVQSSNFSFASGLFRSNGIQLREGPNYLVITAFNSAGQDTKTMVVNYEKVVQQPIITMIEPGSNPYTSASDIMDIRAEILHIENRSQISCSFNGLITQGFTFNGTSFEMKNVSLNQGSNTLVITATNAAGVASVTQIILYNPVIVQKPIVQITFPTTNPFSTAQSTVNLVASIQHIDNASQVSVLHNGKVVTNFTYKAGMLVLSSVALDQGSNTFVITATNSAGSDTKSTIVIYTPPIRRPVVQITNPAIDPLNTSVATINLTAITQNIDLPSQVQVLHNGNMVSNFTFANNMVSLSSFALVSGSNNFEVRVQNDFGQANDQTIVIYQAPLPGPTIDIKSPASSPWTSPVDKVNITAITKNVSSKADITFTKNGAAMTNFSFNGNVIVANNVPLSVGQNSFVITVRNQSGQATDQTVVIYKKPIVVLPPVVTIMAPVNGLSVSAPKVNLNAMVTNVSAKSDVTVKLNGQLVNGFNLSGASVTANNLTLSMGSNVITVTGRNSAGQDSKSTTIIYQAPVPGPSVDIKSPASNPWTSPVDKVNITAITKNVLSKADITFTKNGAAMTNFSFNGNVIVANNVPLSAGQNTFVITVRNQSGQATDQTVVIYRKPVVVLPPVVTIMAPVNGLSVSASKVNLNAMVTNVSAKSDVIVKLNGQPVNGFNLSGASVTANNLTLSMGSNVITVTGRNSAGQDSKSTTIIYQAPVPGPSVDIKSPASNPWTSPVDKVNITAITKNVLSKADITFTKNGAAMTNFSFNGNVIVANNVPLSVGQNTFVITVRNQSGQATDQTVVIYKKPVVVKPPVVTIISPQNGFKANVAKVNLNAMVTNVSSKSDVTVKLNGQLVNGFSLNGVSVTANNLSLNAGSNVITVTGRNSAGQDSKSSTVIYRAPMPRPTVDIKSPASSPWSSPVDKVNITAIAKNVASKADITFTKNGAMISNFSFNGNAIVANNIPLSTGQNTFLITVRNVSGQASDQTVVLYAKKVDVVQKPVVTILTPKNGAKVSSSKVNLNAMVTNVSSKANVSVKLNGQLVNGFNLNGASVTANNLSLKPGSNVITVSGRNSAGQESKSTTVIYQAPVQAPTVDIKSPASSPWLSPVNKVNITAIAKNVASKSDITFTKNGAPITNFNFNGNAIVANNVPLTVGNNVFVITVRNTAGQASDQVTVIYKLTNNGTIINNNGNNSNTNANPNNPFGNASSGNNQGQGAGGNGGSNEGGKGKGKGKGGGK